MDEVRKKAIELLPSKYMQTNMEKLTQPTFR